MKNDLRHSPSGPSAPDFLNPLAMDIRILFVMRDALPPFRSDVKALFGKYLARHRVFSDIIGQCSARHRGELTWPAGAAIAAGTFRNGLIGQFNVPFKDAWVLCRHRMPFDLIQVRDKIRSAVIAWAMARFYRKPFVYWMSFPYVEGFQSTAHNRAKAGAIMRMADILRVSLSRRLLYGFVLKRADHVFVQSEAMCSWLAAKGFDRLRMTAVPMGVDTELFRRERVVPAENARFAGRRLIIYLGELDKARHSTFLLDLIAALKEREPSIFLVLAGDACSDEEARWFREEIGRRRLQDDVMLTGWLSQEEAMSYIVRSEVGLSPIPRGPLFDVSSPTKVLEYLALGLPAVANDIPDQEMVIERSGAGVCVPMKIEAFRDAVLRLLQDDALRELCAARGPKYIRAERSYDVLAAHVAHAYELIVSSVATSNAPMPPFPEQ